MKKSKKDITTRLFQDAVLTMLVAELTSAASTFVDGVIIGRFLGDSAIAAYGVAEPYYSIAAMIRCLLMAGCVTLCTRALGKGDKKRAGSVFSLTVTGGLILAVALMVFGLIFSPQIAAAFGARGDAADILPIAVGYLRGIFPGAPAFILFIVLIPILQLDGDARRPKVASITCGIVNVIGDLLNVYVFKAGMFGMGLATTVSQYAALAVMLTHFLKKGSLFRFQLREMQKNDIPELAREGMPSAVSMICRALLPILLNPWTVTLAGGAGLTAYSVQHNMNFLIGALGWGIGGAVLLMAGVCAGEQDVNGITKVAGTALRDILFGVGAIAAAVIIFAGPLARLYLPGGGESMKIATMAVRFYALALPFIAFNVAGANFFLATSRRLDAYLVNIGTEVACVVIPAWILGRIFGITGVWIAFPVGHAILSLLIILRARSLKKGQHQGLTDWLMLRADFGVPDEDCISRKLHNMEEVTAFSEDLISFCREHELDELHANRIALCVEEIAGNVVEHGFLPGASNHLDVRITKKNDDTIIRIRDDCAHFDFKEQAAAFVPDPEHPEKNIGVRIVMKLAKDIAYANTMNTNNLTITL